MALTITLNVLPTVAGPRCRAVVYVDVMLKKDEEQI